MDSQASSIHVTEQVPITIPLERNTQANVSGRSGSLMQMKSEDVYDDMILTAACFISGPT